MKKKAELKKIKLKNIRPNSHMDIDNYHIDEEKVQNLIKSIKKTGFWGFNGRIKGNEYEICAHHHNLIALHMIYDPEKEIEVKVEDLDDEQMFWRMVEEINDVYNCLPSQRDLIVRKACERLKNNPALQREVFPKAKRVRFGARMVAKYLGRDWTEPIVDCSMRRIDLIDEGILNREVVYEMRSFDATDEFTRSVKKLRPDFDVQLKAAKKIKRKNISGKAIEETIEEFIDEKYPPTEKVRLERSKRSRIAQYEQLLSTSSTQMNKTIRNLKDFKKNLGSRRKQTLNDISPRVRINLNKSINKFNECVKDTLDFMGMDLKDDDTLKEEATKIERDRIQKELYEERVLPPKGKNGTPELRFTNFSEIMNIFRRCFSLFEFPPGEERVLHEDGKFWIEGRNGGVCYFTKNLGKNNSFSIPRHDVEKFTAIKADDVIIKKSQKDKEFRIDIGSVSLTLPKDEFISEINDSVFRPSHENVFSFDESLMNLISELEFIVRRGVEFVDVGGIYFGREFAYVTDKVRVLRMINMMEEFEGNILPVSLINFIRSRKEKPSSIAFEGDKIFLIYGDKEEIEFIVYASASAHRFNEVVESMEGLIPKDDYREVIIDKGKNALRGFKDFIAFSSGEKDSAEIIDVSIDKESNMMEVFAGKKINTEIPLEETHENISFKVRARDLYDGLERFDRFFVSDRCIFFPGDNEEYLVMKAK